MFPLHHHWGMTMTAKIDTAFMRRAALALVSAVQDHRWDDVETATAALARELNVKVPASIEAKMQRAFAEQQG
jgi:hypothetical protein